jgi:hypothetical protein
MSLHDNLRQRHRCSTQLIRSASTRDQGFLAAQQAWLLTLKLPKAIDSPSYCRILLRLKEEKKEIDRVDFKLKTAVGAANSDQVPRRSRTRVHQLRRFTSEAANF